MGILVSRKVQYRDFSSDGKHPSPSLLPPYQTAGTNTLSLENDGKAKWMDKAQVRAPLLSIDIDSLSSDDDAAMIVPSLTILQFWVKSTVSLLLSCSSIMLVLILSILSFSRKRPDRFLLYTGYHGRGTAFPAGMPVFYRRGLFRRSPPGLWLNLERSLPHDSLADP